MSATIKSTVIKRALLQQLSASNGFTIINSTMLACILAYVLRNLISITVIKVWLSVFVCLNAVRFILMFNFKRNPAITNAAIDMQLLQFRVGLIASAFLWGLASIFMYPPNAPLYQMLLIFMLAGLSAGAVVSYAVDFISAVSFVLLILMPIVVRMFLGKGEVAIAMTISIVLYIIYMIISIGKINRNLLDTISSRYDADEREQEIKQLAFYDVLTNLPNRRLMYDRLTHALTLSARTSRGGALLFLDLDNFKTLNDTLGHDIGDLLLKQVAERLLSCVRASDTVARFGGDEFTVMLEDLSQNADEAGAQTDTIAKQIIASLNLPYQLNTHQYHSTASIGVAMFGDDGSTHEELLKNADVAMYKAKRSGRNVVRYFDLGMQEISNAQNVHGVEG
jgi:diguanylate cyclase (GGDEF)-like protein